MVTPIPFRDNLLSAQSSQDMLTPLLKNPALTRSQNSHLERSIVTESFLYLGNPLVSKVEVKDVLVTLSCIFGK